MSEMKKCPFCAEEVLDEAIKCKHCGEWLDDRHQSQVAIKPQKRTTVDVYDRRTLEFVLALIGGIIGIGTSFLQMFIGAFGDLELANLGYAAFIFSLIGIVGGVISRSNGKVGGSILVISTLGGVISSSLLFIVPGILFIIPGVMGLKKDNQEGKSFKWPIWLVIGILTIVFVFVLAFYSDSDDNQENQNSQSNKSNNISSESLNYMHETVETGSLSYFLNKNTKSSSLDGIFEEMYPRGTFLLCEVTIVNIGLESKTIDMSMFSLVDGENRTFEPDFDATMDYSENDLFLTDLGPGLSMTVHVVFDVPTLETSFKLGVSDGMFSDQYKWIQLNKRKENSSQAPSKEVTTTKEAVTSKETIKLPLNKETTEANSVESDMPELVYNLVKGVQFEGYAYDDNSGKSWDFKLNVISWNENTGAFVGRMAWPALDSVNEIEGYLFENSDGVYEMSFEETAYVVQGGAVLGCQYTAFHEFSDGGDVFRGPWWFDKYNQSGTVYFRQP